MSLKSCDIPKAQLCVVNWSQNPPHLAFSEVAPSWKRKSKGIPGRRECATKFQELFKSAPSIPLAGYLILFLSKQNFSVLMEVRAIIFLFHTTQPNCSTQVIRRFFFLCDCIYSFIIPVSGEVRLMLRKFVFLLTLLECTCFKEPQFASILQTNFEKETEKLRRMSLVKFKAETNR